MSARLFSSSWYRVAELKPRLRGHAEIHRQQYRGELWYVLQDHASGRYHRFTPAAYFLVSLMDGQHAVQAIWEMASARLGDEAPTQDEVIQLLTQLHAADVLLTDVSPDTTEMLLRHERQQKQTWRQQLMSPLFWRFPLFDPERLLEWFLPLVRPCFGVFGLLLWIAVMAVATVLAAMHWHDLTEGVVDRILAPQSLLLIWLVYPVVKSLHEFGHAFATKVYGGEVHEMGVMLLVLMPLPYMDASAAWTFRSKWQRILVGSAGMMVELFLASLALFVWLNVEPGVVRTLAYNVMFIAGVSTLLFNGNPFLRYDGYYIFSDLLEIPNLRMRANAYVGYLCEHYLFGGDEAEVEQATPSERAWFVFFAVASWLYRVLVLVAIVLFVAEKFFFVGVVLALAGVAMWVGVPVVKLLSYLSTSPRLRRVRFRATAVSVLALMVLVGVIGWVPVPFRSRAEGVVWVPEEGIVRAGADGFVERIVVPPGTHVSPGAALIVARDRDLDTRVEVLALRLDELHTRYAVRWLEDPAQAEIIKEEIALVTQNLRRARERVKELTIWSRADGAFVVPEAQDLPGRFIRQGTPVGYVLGPGSLIVRLVVSQSDIDLVRHRSRSIDVRFAERLAESFPATVKREVPGATVELPSPALSSQGGGEIAVDPRDAEGLKAMHNFFQLDLELPLGAGPVSIGGRVFVRFDHGAEPLAQRWYRELRRLLLSRFLV